MYATLGRYDQISASQDEVIVAGRQLASALSKAPGFISYALLDLGNGVLASMCIFDTQTELVAAEGLIATWVATHGGSPLAAPAHTRTGEILVQKGM